MSGDVEEGAKKIVEEVETRAKGMVKKGQRQMAGYKQSVNVKRKSNLEKGRSGWESAGRKLDLWEFLTFSLDSLATRYLHPWCTQGLYYFLIICNPRSIP